MALVAIDTQSSLFVAVGDVSQQHDVERRSTFAPRTLAAASEAQLLVHKENIKLRKNHKKKLMQSQGFDYKKSIVFVQIWKQNKRKECKVSRSLLTLFNSNQFTPSFLNTRTTC